MPAPAARRGANRRALADARARILAPMITEITERGVKNYAEIARQLNALGRTTYKGGAWSGNSVRNVLRRVQTI